ncbi:DUF362 domain-containing protein [Candidatus Bathyarchaeota archaeon]|nr:DUF362 domain-containing protein [Candidatus Bathyarchaeota archaeon]
MLWERTALLHSYRVLKQAGIIDAAEKAGAEIRVFEKDRWQALFDRSGWRRVKVNGSRYLRRVSVAKEVFEIKKIVYAPLIKTHHAAEYTGNLSLNSIS